MIQHILLIGVAISYTIAIIVIAYRWLEPRDSRRQTGVRVKAQPRGVG